MSEPAPRFLVLVRSHFDVLWRRRREDGHREGGRRFAGYRTMEAWYLSACLELADRDPAFAFELECTQVLAEFMAGNPGPAAAVRRLAAAGRFAVAGGGWNIVDGNLVLAETIIRNFTIGFAELERLLGPVPAADPRLAIRNDAFGNPAQLPQILAGCGFRAVSGLSYSPARGDAWQGLDGTVIPVVDPPRAARWGMGGYVPPCAACAGEGCPACGGRGVAPRPAPPWPAPTEPDAVQGWGLIEVGGEEGVPDDGLLTAVRALAGRGPVAYTTSGALLDRLLPAAGTEPRLHPGVELNPNNTGCYTTRIRTKQHLRRLERRLLAWEHLLARQGAAPADLDRAWTAVLLGAFHDCVTGTLIDAAYDELMAALRAGEAAVDAAAHAVRTTATDDAAWVFQPGADAIPAEVWLPDRDGIAAVETPDGRRHPAERRTDGPHGPGLRVAIPALVPGAVPLRLHAGPAAAVEPVATADGSIRMANGHLVVEGDGAGLTRIHRADGTPVCVAGTWRPGQPILENDIGSPWATLYDDRRRRAVDRLVEPLGAWRGPGWQELRYRMHTPWNTAGRSRGMVMEVAYRLEDALPWLAVRIDVLWESFDTRLRLAWPLARSGVHRFGVPAGHLERAPYAATGLGAWDGACGDHAAVEWSAVDHGDGWTGVMDRGTPGRLWEPGESGGTLFVSLLRSPNQPTYLYKPDIGGPHGYDGMRDEGRHRLWCALAAGSGAATDSGLAAWASGWNTVLPTGLGHLALPPGGLVDSPDGVELAACLRTPDGALAVRLVERRGRPARATIRLPAPATRVVRTDLRLRPLPGIPDTSGPVELRPFEIATVVLR
jgi:hypothetical protein